MAAAAAYARAEKAEATRRAKAAALGADTAEVLLALRMALSLEGIECQPK